MVINKIYKYIEINDCSLTPKYLQLSNAIIKAIKEGKLLPGESLPSLNEISFEYEIARATVEKGYNYLKKNGAIDSIQGKGYFIKNLQEHEKIKILILFDQLSPEKRCIYDALVACLPETALVELLIYNNDYGFFKKLLTTRIRQYTHFLILPNFKEGGENAHEVINQIPLEKLILIGRLIPEVKGAFATFYQDFGKNIYQSLEQAIPLLSKYHSIKIICLDYELFPTEIIDGFINFCNQFAFNYYLIKNLSDLVINKGDVFITYDENDLIVLIEQILSTNFKVGKEIGVISYNESALKKVILNGITTISTDFQFVGESVAQAIMNGTQGIEEMPFKLTIRESL